MITRTTNDAFQLLQFINTLLRIGLLTPVMFTVSLVMILRTSLSSIYSISSNNTIYINWGSSYS